MSTYLSPVEVPCVGFGFGDCVLLELLEELNLVNTQRSEPIPFRNNPVPKQLRCGIAQDPSYEPPEHNRQAGTGWRGPS